MENTAGNRLSSGKDMAVSLSGLKKNRISRSSLLSHFR